MIPKIIHYCWFGHKPLPKTAIKCINSWRKFFPDYVIKEWNEDNFDVNIIPYTKEAYNAKKYAFVSDYARMWILYNYGGLYFDTDVEVVKSMNDIVEQGPFMGIETRNNPSIAPGLGLGCNKHNPIYLEILNLYERDQERINQFKNGNIVFFTTKVLKKHGFSDVDEIQNIDGITIYPHDFFNPYDYISKKLNITNNTRSIHWYDASWMSQSKRIKFIIGRYIRKYLCVQ